MPGRHLKRYIAYNAGLWVVVALTGALVLTGARQYGHAQMARQTARHLLDGARKAADRGGLYEAQRAIREALEAYPPISSEVAVGFGRTMTGMPLVQAEMLRLDKEGVAPLDTAGRLTLTLARGASPKELALARPTPGAGELNLWLGRTLLARGDVAGAAECFRVYWTKENAQRARITAKLTTKNPRNGEDEYAAGKRMVFNGLLPEALTAFDRARAAGYENADMTFWKGAAAELAGRRDEAQTHYAEALKCLPNHRLALLRMKALEKK
jgi:predicted negative regulator of RcsB-dependent stress response